MSQSDPTAPAISASQREMAAEAYGMLQIDLGALARNYRLMCSTAAPSECAAVVKADAYGLGLGPVAKRLDREGCRRFFVATVAEGLQLRQVLRDASVYVLDGLDERLVRLCVEARLTPVLNSPLQVECWRATQRPAVLHVDTGMSRLGLDEAEIHRLKPFEDLRVELVMTHFACADTASHALNDTQRRRFEAWRSLLPQAPTSVANSAGAFLGPAYRGDVVRAGIALYGGNPFSDRANPTECVATLRGRVLQLRDVAVPTTVGYGATFTAEPPCRLAVCGIGYADGYPRAAGNRCDASFRGRRVPVVGRVSMDLTCVDVTAVPPGELQVGDYLDFINADVHVDEVATAAGTIGYEILTGFGRRLVRKYEN